MRQFRIPLAGQFNTRIDQASTDTSLGIWGIGVWGIFVWGKTIATSQKDRRFQNCFTHMIEGKPYLMKRPGWSTLNTPSAGNVGNCLLIWTGQGTGQKVISSFGATNSTIYDGTTSLGAITGIATSITETFIGTEATLLISSSDNTAWSTSSSAITGALTFTGDTHTSTLVDAISSTAGLIVGQILTGTGFSANTRIASIDSATAITLNQVTTATNAGVTITRTVLGKVIDVDFPGNAGYALAGSFAHMDGFAVIMTKDGKLWASDLNTVTGWTSNSYDSANAYPDKGTGCIRHKNFIIAFGTESMQIFYNAGLTPFPFAKATSQTQKIGCVAGAGVGDTISSISDYIFFLGSTPQGGLSVFQYDGSISRISTPELDAALLSIGTNNISISTEREYGLSFVNVLANKTTFVYCIEDKNWHEKTGITKLWYKVVGLSIGDVLVNYAISKDSTSGIVYTMNPANFVFTDGGVAYTAVAQTNNEDHGTSKWKFYNELTLIADTEIVTSPVTILWSDDDYQSFTTWGTLDLNSYSPKATRLGRSRNRAWRLEHSANTPFRIQYLECQVEIGQ